MIDLHSHTVRCNHAVGTPHEYAEAAVSAGLRFFGQSCHSPWMIQSPNQQAAMLPEEVELYVADTLRLKDEFSDRIQILLGMEMDYYPECEEQIRATAEAYPFDYLLGSIHHLPQFPGENPSVRRLFLHHEEREIWRCYFEAMLMMVRTDLVDIVSHFDLPKLKSTLSPDEWMPLADPVIEELAGGRIAVELNTSGRDKPIGQFYPNEPLLRRMADAGVPITLGSDAHTPKHVARHFGEALALLRDCGFRELTYYIEREACKLPLN